ncbi:MAG: hypothetical protein ABI333_05325 [bacterium]
MANSADTPKAQTKIPTTQLTGDVEREYVKQLTAMLRTGRLNVHYPESARLRDHVSAMSPDVHRGLYPGLEIDLRSGLPTYKEWTRVQTDCTLAEQMLEDLGSLEKLERKATERTDLIYGKQLLKHHYFSELKGRRLAALGDMKVALRRVDPDTKTAWFNVVLDKLDASGLFVRFTIDLGQTDSVWNKSMVRLDADTAKHTEEFRTLIYRFTSLDAEFTFFKLVTFGGLTVERVIKGTVGPVYFAGLDAPGPLGQLVARQPRGFVASFPLDMAACDLASDRDNDPLEDPLVLTLSEEALPDYERAREGMGYKVFKDRKFVTSQSLEAVVREFCDQAGTKNIIKTVGGSK